MTISINPTQDMNADRLVRQAVFNVELELEPLMPSTALLSSFGTEYLTAFRTEVNREFEATRARVLWSLLEEIDAILLERRSSR